MTYSQSGFRDFLYSAANLRWWCVFQMVKTYQAHGFTPLETPALEDLRLLLGKGGNENEKMIFKILKRGRSLSQVLEKISSYDLLTSSDDLSLENQLTDYGLRFDLTLPLSRVLETQRDAIRLPWKVFHIGPVWRAERAQKGRFREFIQCDVDILGVPELQAELQVIQAAIQALIHLGMDAGEFELVINDRRLVDAMAITWGFRQDQLKAFAILLDKKDKLEELVLFEEFEKLWREGREAGEGLPSEKWRDLSMNHGVFHKSMSWKTAETLHEEAAQNLQRLIQGLIDLALPVKKVCFDPCLVRGMGYYTGPIFELRHASAGYSFGGGGRYDGLVKGLPACGMSLGFERLFVLLQEKQAQTGRSLVKNTLFMPVLEESKRPLLQVLAVRLRQQGLGVDVYPGFTSLKAQLKWASHAGYRWVLLLGDQEARSGLLTLKDFQTGEEKTFSEKDLIHFLSQPISQ